MSQRPRFPAYFSVCFSALDQGQLAQASMSGGAGLLATVEKRMVERYEALLRAGVICAADQDEDREAEDRLAGDDRYVVLSLGQLHWEEPAAVIFGFLFDATRLLEQGAILRTRNLFDDYVDLIGTLMEERTEFTPPTREEMRPVLDALAGDQSLVDQGVKVPNAAYYALSGAVLYQREEVPGAEQVREDFRCLIRPKQEAVQLTDLRALEYLQGASHMEGCALLVADQLPLSHAVAVIEHGMLRSL